jgi:hypothetical protein
MPDEPSSLVWMVPEDLAEQIEEWAKLRNISRYDALHELVKRGLSEPVAPMHPAQWLGKTGRA